MLSELRKINKDNDVVYALDRTDALIKLALDQEAKKAKAAATATTVEPGSV
jgi:hypothetical protein